MVRGDLLCWPLFGYYFRTPCLLVKDTCGAAPRLSSSLSHSNAKFAVPPCALGFGTKDGSFTRALRFEDTLPALGGTVCELHCSHSYDTAIRRCRSAWMELWRLFLCGCLFACVYFISREIPFLSFRPPTAWLQGTVVHLLSHVPVT